MNPATEKIMDEYKEQIYKAAIIYKNTELSNCDCFMISKEFLDNFKEKINYNEINDLLIKKDEDKYKKFSELLNKLEFDDLESVIFDEIQMFGGLEDLEDNINKGFEFVSKDFLETLEYEIVHETYYKVKYIKDGDNIIIIFSDDSKLLIIQNGTEIKYHAIPAPIKPTKKKPIRRANSIFIRRVKKHELEADNKISEKK